MMKPGQNRNHTFTTLSLFFQKNSVRAHNPFIDTSEKIHLWRCGILLFIVLILIIFCQTAQASRAIKIQLKDNKGKSARQVQLYGGSYALLIGASNYTAGWPKLESIPGELSKVEKLLKNKGFVVEYHLDPDHDQIQKLYEGFIERYGYNQENRLLFYYSGHGHTRNNGRKGYLVPVDAPNPNIDEIGFVKKALGMNQIISWARDIEAKHVIFLFDSCFSGTIFKQKELPAPPKYITSLTTKSVRQFITAGSAGEAVPANSTFTPAFVDALQYNLADLNGDNYVSGTELGLYLQAKVPQHSDQSPQFGKIGDYELSRGDFIFLAGGNLDDQVTDKPKNYSKRAKYGSLQITSSPSGSSVKVDGKPAGQTPVQLDRIPPGSVRISIFKDGYHEKEQLVTIKKGRKTAVNFDLDEKPRNGRLTVIAKPNNAKVQIDNIGSAYSPGLELAPGRYHIIVSALGHTPEKRWVNLASGSSLTVSFRLTKTPVPKAKTPDQSKKNGSLKISSTPSGSKIIINGKPAGQTPVQLDKIPPGPVQISISKSGYHPKEQLVTVKKGRKTAVNFDLDEKEKKGILKVLTRPNSAKVQILNIAQKYSSGMELKPGRYHIKVSASEYTSEKRWVNLSPGGSLTVSFRLELLKKSKPEPEVALPEKPSKPTRPAVIKSGGRFIAYADKTVEDTKTGLMWAARDNGKDISWKDAKHYCETYRGGGYTDWRTPSEKELTELYNNKISPKNKPGNHIIELTKGYIWTSETRGGKAAFFYFDDGLKLWYDKSNFFYLRALPVRRNK